jgi:hypothetical protein
MTDRHPAQQDQHDQHAIRVRHHAATAAAAAGRSAGHQRHQVSGVRSMALAATLHCLTGCAIGEIAGLMIGTAAGLAAGWTIALAISLAFLFGYTLSTLPLLKAGLSLGAALSVVLAADTLSIATMEVVDNVVMAAIPGAMNAGLANVEFWVGMMLALTAAFVAAYPVNLHLLQRGKGHALTHGHHGGGEVTGARQLIPSLSTSALVAALVAFMLGGLVASIADQSSGGSSEQGTGGGHADLEGRGQAGSAEPRTTRLLRGTGTQLGRAAEPAEPAPSAALRWLALTHAAQTGHLTGANRPGSLHAQPQ